MASTRTWFETVAEAQRRAKRRLPRSVYLAVVAGAEAGVTMNDNVRAFSELRFRPHVAGLPAARELSTAVMGLQVRLPVLISPTGVHGLHPGGGDQHRKADLKAHDGGGKLTFRGQTGHVRPETEFGERPDVVVHGDARLGAGHHRQVHRPGQLPLGTALRLGDRLEPISRACHLGVS